jgi:glycosyltransferase involved in cell wall biosynthesis
MPKLAVFLSDLLGGGAERVMLNLASGFVGKGYTVDLVLARKEGSYLSQIPSEIRLIDLKAKSLLRSTTLLSRYLQTEKPVALLSALEDTNIVAILAKQLAKVKTPLVVTVHNNLSQESRNATSLKRKFVPYLLRWFYPFADVVVAVSQGVADDLVKLGLQPHKIKVIYNPIVTPELKQKLRESLEHPWFVEGEPPVIIGVGRLNQQKDFATLIQAFAKVRQQLPVRLIILGEGEERLRLEAIARELGIAEDIALPGFVDNPYIYMAKAAVLVLSSAWEGFGNVLVEAMAAETPVVSTNCDSGPAEILADGKYGKLVEVGDPNHMAEAILLSLKQKPQPETLKHIANSFSLEEAVNCYLKTIKDTL